MQNVLSMYNLYQFHRQKLFSNDCLVAELEIRSLIVQKSNPLHKFYNVEHNPPPNPVQQTMQQTTAKSLHAYSPIA